MDKNEFIEQVGVLKGPFRWFRNQQTRFTFSDGTMWRQNEPKYLYLYAANPRTRVMHNNGVCRLEVAGTDQTVAVIKEEQRRCRT